MSSGKCASLDCRANSQIPKSLVTAIAVVVLISALGLAPNADGKRKSRNKNREPAAQSAKNDDAKVTEDRPAKRGGAKKRSGHRLDQAALRYLPDDCGVYGWIKVAPMLASEMGRKFTQENADFWNACCEQVAPLALSSDHIDRIAFGARSVTEGEASKAVMILFCKQPVQPSGRQVSADGTPWTTETIGPRTMWAKGGSDPWAVCLVEDRVVLAGYPEPVRAILGRDGPIELPKKLERAHGFLDPAAVMAMSFLPPDDFVQANGLPLPIAYQLLGQIEAFNLELDFDAGLGIGLSAVCSDEAAAQQLNGIAKGLWALVQMQSLDDQQPEVRDVIRSVAFDVEGPVLTASVDVPSRLFQLTECARKGGGGRSWELGLNKPNAATTKLSGDGCRLAAAPNSQLPSPSRAASTPPPGPVAAVYPGAARGFYQPGVPASPTPTVPQPCSPPSVPGTPTPYVAPPSCPPSAPATPSPYAATPSPYSATPSPYSATPSPYSATPSPYSAPPSYAPGRPAVPSYGAPSTVPPPTFGQPPMPKLPTLQIADVVRLVEAGVDDEIITRHIQKHRLAVDLTADDLILLTESGASTPVITALQEIPVAPKPTPQQLNPYSTNAQAQLLFPSQLQGRSDALIFTSESLRRLLEEWERIWFLEQPNHAPPMRTHGGII